MDASLEGSGTGDVCKVEWLNDGYCDFECAFSDCGNDVGDCSESLNFCSFGCENKLVGDGSCDANCYNEDCKFDLGDCTGELHPLTWD